jgi:prepilin-type processing-associated H-X9-DG protein
VELLVVIGIIVILLAILLPALGKARAQAQRAQCLSNERQILSAILNYCGDNKGVLPGPVGPAVIDPYTANAVPPATTSLLWQWGDSANNSASSVPPAYGNVASTQQGGWECHMLSSTNLLQNYLGGIDGRGVWRCPASDNIFNAPVAGGIFKGHVPGYGYKLNNSRNTALNHGNGDSGGEIVADAANGYYFGDWNSVPTPTSTTDSVVIAQEWPPKKISAILAAVGPSQAVVGNSYITGTVSATNPTGASVVLVADASKTWLVSDLDARDMGSDQTASWGIVTYGGSTPYTTAYKNTLTYQPVHTSGGYLGRNYGFADGHAEYLLINDWPNAVYEYP